MALSFNFAKELEIEMANSQYHITSLEELYDYFDQLPDPFSRGTVKSMVKDFEKMIYFSHRCYINPIYKLSFPIPISLLNGLSNVHTLMYRFLTDPVHGIPKCEAETNTLIDSLPPCTWRIPSIFMPFLAAYISANHARKNSVLSPSIFFESLKHYFDKFLEHSEKYISPHLLKKMDSIFQEWADIYLGQHYFVNLDKLLSRSNNETFKNSVSTGITCITNALMCAPLCPNPVSYYANRILEDYKIQIETIGIEEMSSNYIPWDIHHEPDFIYYLGNIIFSKIELLDNSIYSALEDHHVRDSKYELAIDSYDSFYKDISENLEDLQSFQSHIRVELESFFTHYKQIPDIESAIEDFRLLINGTIEQKHIDSFTRILNKCIDSTISDLEKFLRLVKSASSSNPEKLKKITTEKNYYDNFHADLLLNCENCNADIKSTLKKLPTVFLYNKNPDSLPQQRGYHSFLNIQDILKIISLLHRGSKASSDDDKIKILSDNGFFEPMDSRQLALFLLKFNTLFPDER